jgi:2-keto-4-pentenoate hydratase
VPRLTAADARRAAGLISEAIAEGQSLPPLPAAYRPATPAAGRRVAGLVLDGLGVPSVGLRLAPLGETGEEAAGPIIETRLLRAPVALPPPAMPTGRRITLAVLAQLAADLPPRARPWRAAEVVRRLGSLHPALDLAESRFADGAADRPSHLADLSALGLVVFGRPARAGWQAAVAAPLAAVAGGAGGAAWRGKVDIAAALTRAAEAARAAGGLPKGALLLVAGLSPPLPEGALAARVTRIGAVERLA